MDHGTHNGMKSIVYNLKTKDFARIRIGTGMPENKNELINYVINKMNEQEYKKYLPGIEKGKDAIVEILKNTIDLAMNKIN